MGFVGTIGTDGRDPFFELEWKEEGEGGRGLLDVGVSGGLS